MKGQPAITARGARPARNQAQSRFLRGWAIFFREALYNPRDVGALIPSSRTLARRMARLVEPGGDGFVIELGAGTGVVTEALLDRGVPPRRLIALERSAPLADLLHTRFPDIRVICGDAADLRLLLRHAQISTGHPHPPPPAPPTQIVSSLPLRILPPDKVHAILREIAAVLRPGGHWIQYTYALRHRYVPAGFLRRESNFVWKNVPPARIDVYKPVTRI